MKICFIISFSVSSVIFVFLVFFFSVFVEDFLHLFDGLSVFVVENLLSSISDHLFKHLLVINKKEFKPAALSFIFNFNIQFLVNFFILLLDKLGEFFCSVLESTFPSDSFNKLENLLDENEKNT